ncbi:MULTISPECIES: SAP domain-containing protein [unclassified Caballeronia]|uniref:SAP domain-containing protein n=1 Tax=unclassified Caballeronia TaxID=2646786 RepID=UPI0020293E99|nr:MULTISPECIES: SAP domain-containing protein [unclassified Caballeronia]MDR5770106.1 SAP domain-containing protein [Caballeronia sp. LZ028]
MHYNASFLETSLNFSLFDQRQSPVNELFVEGKLDSGYQLELRGSRRAYALAVAGGTEALALLLARGEWTCPQLDALIAEQGAVFQPQMTKKLQSKRFRACQTESQLRKAQEEFESEVWHTMRNALPPQILAERPVHPTWMSQVFVEAPTAFIIAKIERLAKYGAQFLGNPPTRTNFAEPQQRDDWRSAYDWLWAMGWVKRGFELDTQVFLRTLTVEVLKDQCNQCGWKTSGTKEELVQRVFDRLGDEGVRASRVFSQFWPRIYQLEPTIVPEPNQLYAAWRWYTTYATFFVELLARKRDELESSAIRAFGFLKLNSEQCNDLCSRPTITGDYDPKLHRVPPYGLLCRCHVEKDYDRLHAALKAEEQRRRMKFGVREQISIFKTDVENLQNDLVDAFVRIDDATRVDCLLVDANEVDEDATPDSFHYAISMGRKGPGEIELEVYCADGASEGEDGVPRELRDAGWVRTNEEQDGEGSLSWRMLLTPGIPLREATANAVALAVDQLRTVVAAPIHTFDRAAGASATQLDRIWISVEVNYFPKAGRYAERNDGR